MGRISVRGGFPKSNLSNLSNPSNLINLSNLTLAPPLGLISVRGRPPGAKGQGTWEGQSNAPPFYRVCLESRLEELYDRHPNLMPSADDDCWESD